VLHYLTKSRYARDAAVWQGINPTLNMSFLEP
jgi:hypothetical protein